MTPEHPPGQGLQSVASSAERPNHRYYTACEGVWRADLAMRITDRGRLAGSGMPLVDRLAVHLMTAWPRGLGSLSFHTTVTYVASATVRHTTMVRWLGIPIWRSVEMIALDPDGRRFTVSGGATGSGTIDPTGTRAEYELQWHGVTVQQRTVRAADLVMVTQTGPGFEGVQNLARQLGA